MTTRAERLQDVTDLLLPVALLVLSLGAVAVQVVPLPFHLLTSGGVAAPATITLPAGSLIYRAEGNYFRDNLPVDAPQTSVTFQQPLTIMQYQVSAQDYARCVADGACLPADQAGAGNVPVTGVNFTDATAYAEWLSAQTGQSWALPSDAEWAYAAGERYVDDVLGLDAGNANPATRWIADYRLEAARSRASDPAIKPLGAFGANTNGLMDMASNVWEWTDSCHRRVHLDTAGVIGSDSSACTIRVLEGKHRTAMSYFIRDAKSGGCSVGLPPDHLGFRLVRRPAWYEKIFGFFGQ